MLTEIGSDEECAEEEVPRLTSDVVVEVSCGDGVDGAGSLAEGGEGLFTLEILVITGGVQ